MIEANISKGDVEITAGKSCLDNIFCLKQVIAKQNGKNKETNLFYVDLEEAYNMVSRKMLWPVIGEVGVPQEILVVIQKMCANNEAHVKTGNKISAGLETNTGLKQGCG